MNMRKFFKLNGGGIVMLLAMLLCSVFGIAGAEVLFAEATGGPAPLYGDQILDENGVVIDELIDLTDASVKAPELISKHFVQEVIRVDPYSYPTMAILQANYHWRKKEKTRDHIIQVNRVTTPPVQITTAAAITESALAQVAVNFGQGNAIIGLHQTIYFPTIKGYNEAGDTQTTYCLQCRVVAKDSATGWPILKPINGKKVDGVFTVPSLQIGTKALRGDRIGTETQIRTEQFGILPSPTDYFVPKKLIEFGTSGWYDNATKTIKWGNEEIKQTALTEMLRTSAPGFWLGQQAKATFPEYKSNTPEMTLFPEGLMHQAARDIDLNGTVDINALVNLQTVAFKDNNSGNLKYFAMGSEISPLFQVLILGTSGLNYSVYRNQRLNIDFSEIVYPGGKRIRFIDDPSLDDCGLNDKGFLLDPKWAGTYSYGYEFLPLDGKKTQERDMSGMAVIDESVHVLLNPEANVYVTL